MNLSGQWEGTSSDLFIHFREGRKGSLNLEILLPPP